MYETFTLCLCLLPAWSLTISSRRCVKVRENLSDWQQAHTVKCQCFGMSFNGQTLQYIAIQQTYKTYYHMPALFQQTAWCLMPSTGGRIPFYVVTAFSLRGVSRKDHWMLMNNKMCHFPLEFVYLSYTVKKTCLFSSVCIYMCVKTRTVKPGHMLREYAVLLVFFSLLLLHIIVRPISHKGIKTTSKQIRT